MKTIQLMMKSMNPENNFCKLLLQAGLLFLPLVSYSQEERLFPLMSNPALKAASVHENRASVEKLNSTTDTLVLPFFDDFSRYEVWPAASHWTDSAVFVNHGFAINPPTVGVATFDGLDKEGNAYVNNNVNASGLCDVLTSKPIDLFADNNGIPYGPSDSIFLVFYYQRKGRGDNPETNDSLQLQFFNPVTQQWVRAWGKTGVAGGDTSFTKVTLSITNPDFRQKGFRFRFRNFGSQTGMLDIWNIDYIHLNRFLPPEYDVLRDYAFVYAGQSLLNNYSSVPWKHFTSLSASQQQAFVRSSATLTIRNNNDANPFPVKVAGTIYDQYNNPTTIVGGGGLNSIVIPLNSNVSPPASLLSNSFFQDPTTGDQAVFTAVYEIGQTSGGVVDDFPLNDTIRYVQNFHDYYSYDDGSAELAYGVSGAGAQLAYRFDVLDADTLRAVQMFWAQSGLDVSGQIFRLAIWSGNASGPVGAPVYQKFNQTPNYIDSINGFYTYNTDPILIPAGTWYVGYIQNNATILNLGLDMNTPADNSRKFINTTGSWINSQLPGMWMIRPIFSEQPLYTSVPAVGSEGLLQVYPNPASGQVSLSLKERIGNDYRISVCDFAGREVMGYDQFQSLIDVSGLAKGVYILRVTERFTGNSFAQKLIVSGN